MSHTVNEIRALVGTWTPEQLRCRAAGTHAWLDEDWIYMRGQGYYRVETPCARGCGLTRYFDQDALGHRSPSWTSYSEGYLSTIGRLDDRDREVVRDSHRRVAATRGRTETEQRGMEPKPHFRGHWTPVVAGRSDYRPRKRRAS